MPTRTRAGLVVGVAVWLAVAALTGPAGAQQAPAPQAPAPAPDAPAPAAPPEPQAYALERVPDERKVKNARLGLTHNLGGVPWSNVSAVAIIGREG